MHTMIDSGLVADHNAKLQANLEADYAALGGMLARRGLDIEQLTALAQTFAVAVPSWGAGTGGTRFARFPGLGEPRNVFEKLRRLRRDQPADAQPRPPCRCTSHGTRSATRRPCARRREPTAWASTPSIPTPSRTRPARRSPTNTAA